MREYRTPKAPFECKSEIKKSIFIAALEHIDSEEQASKIILSARSSHTKASHHCYAYIIGPQSAIARSSDDGEPQGTAGKPILEAMRMANLGFSCLVVTRYFGGIKLGAAGLSRAYAASASQAIKSCELLLMREHIIINADVAYESLSLAKRYISQQGCTLLNEQYGQLASLEIAAANEAAAGAALSYFAGSLKAEAVLAPCNKYIPISEGA
ncbi:MAG: YigZ family protein [Eubacteriaceae bacterium]|nr:YigZ family protein [Eubacteriaceae bacterium]